jgi:hypothetical protein
MCDIFNFILDIREIIIYIYIYNIMSDLKQSTNKEEYEPYVDEYERYRYEEYEKYEPLNIYEINDEEYEKYEKYEPLNIYEINDEEYEKYGDEEYEKYGDEEYEKYGDEEYEKYGDEEYEKYGDEKYEDKEIIEMTTEQKKELKIHEETVDRFRYILNIPELYLFISFGLIPEYINSNIGANSFEMWKVFNDFNIIQYPDLKISFDEWEMMSGNNPIYGHHIIEIAAESHSMKLVYVNDFFVFINSGRGIENNNGEIFLIGRLKETNNVKVFCDEIKEIMSINQIYKYFTNNTNTIDSNIYMKDFESICNIQISGSCTYYSTLYAYLFILYNRDKLISDNDGGKNDATSREKSIKRIKEYKNKIIDYSLSLLSKINIPLLINTYTEKIYEISLNFIDTLHIFNVIYRKYNDKYDLENLKNIRDDTENLYYNIRKGYNKTDDYVGSNNTSYEFYKSGFDKMSQIESVYYYYLNWCHKQNNYAFEENEIHYQKYLMNELDTNKKIDILYFMVSISSTTEIKNENIINETFKQKYCKIIDKLILCEKFIDRLDTDIDINELDRICYLAQVIDSKFYSYLFILIFRVLENYSFEDIYINDMKINILNNDDEMSNLDLQYSNINLYLEASKYINKYKILLMSNHHDIVSVHTKDTIVYMPILISVVKKLLNFDILNIEYISTVTKHYIKENEKKIKSMYIKYNTSRVFNFDKHGRVVMNDFSDIMNITNDKNEMSYVNAKNGNTFGSEDIINKENISRDYENIVLHYFSENEDEETCDFKIFLTDETQISYDTYISNKNFGNNKMTIMNMYIDPFVNITSPENFMNFSDDTLQKIKMNENKLLIPFVVEEKYENSSLLSSYHNETDNFYFKSKELFEKNIQGINLNENESILTNNNITIIYMYFLFYDIYKNKIIMSHPTTQKNIMFLKKNLKNSDDIIGHINVFDYNEEHLNDLYTNLENSLENPYIKSIPFYVKIILKQISENIHVILKNEIINLKNLEYEIKNDGLHFKYINNEEEYYSSQRQNDDEKNEKLKKYYISFEKNESKNKYFFSDIYPNLVRENDYMYMTLNSHDYFYYEVEDENEDEDEDEDGVIIDSLININFKLDNILKFSGNGQSLIYFCEWIVYNKNYVYYETENIETYEKCLFIDNKIIEKYHPRIGFSNNEKNLNIIVTKNTNDEHKLFIFITNRIIDIYLSNENIFGFKPNENFLFNSMFLNKFREKINIKDKEKKHIFEFDVNMMGDNIIDIDLNDDISSFVLLLILSQSHSYEMLSLMTNKLMSYLHLDVFIRYYNHPNGYKIISEIMNKYDLNFPEFEELKEKYKIMETNNLKYDDISELVNELDHVTFIDKIKLNLKNLSNITDWKKLTETKTQKSCIDEIIKNIKDEKNVTYEILMGSGKSKIIIPFVALYQTIVLNKQVIVICPEHLLDDLYKDICNITTNMPLCIVRKIDESFENILYVVNTTTGIILMSDVYFKRSVLERHTDMMNTLHTFYFDRVNVKKINRVLICDEIDDCINPLKSNFNIIETQVYASDILKNILNDKYDKFIDMLIELIRKYVKNINDDNCQSFKNIFKDIVSNNDMLECVCNVCDVETEDNKDKTALYILKKIYNTLKTLNNLVYKKDYGLGDDKSKNTYYHAIPYEGINIPSTNSQFNDVYMTILLTIYIYIKFGIENLREEDWILICDMIEIDTINETVHNACKTFIDKSNESDYKNNYKLKNVIYMQNVSDEILNFYLKSFCIQKIKYIDKYKNTSFLELLNKNIYNVFVGFTGTPEYIGKIENEYPKIEDDEEIFTLNTDFSNRSPYEKIKLFMNVVHKETLDPNKLNELYKYIHNFNNYVAAKNINKSDIDKSFPLKKITILIDTGAIFRLMNPHEYAKEMIFTLHEHYDYIVYFDNDELCELDKNNDIRKINKNVLNKYTNRHLIFFDNVHVRGTDVKLNPDAHALVTISHINDSVNTMQGIYRLREINDQQSCHFICSDDIDIEGGLWKYLINNTQTYVEGQQKDLLLQTLNSMYKWTYYTSEDGKYITPLYNNLGIHVPLIPDFTKNTLDEVLNSDIIYNNKMYIPCECNNMSEQYCLLAKQHGKYLQDSINTSTSVSQSKSNSMSYVQIEQNGEHGIYGSYQPLITDDAFNTYVLSIEDEQLNKYKHSYLSKYTYERMMLQKK